MITRRTSLGIGLAASAACVTGLGACAPSSARRSILGSIDALLVDSDVNVTGPLAALIAASRQKYPALGVKLDARNHTRLNRLMSSSQTLAGLSSGATLFCMEHMARDHGFRLTARCQQGASEDTCLSDVADLLRGIMPASTGMTEALQTYRPSRADNTLHAWVMQKSSPSLRLPAREI